MACDNVYVTSELKVTDGGRWGGGVSFEGFMTAGGVGVHAFVPFGSRQLPKPWENGETIPVETRSPFSDSLDPEHLPHPFERGFIIAGGVHSIASFVR